MRISDWSSDVCSSDLAWIGWRALRGLPGARRPHFVTTVHGLNSPSRYSAVMTRGERVICVSETVRDYVLQHYPRTDPTKLRVVPRGIDPAAFPFASWPDRVARSEEHTSELQSLMRISYAVFCLKKKKKKTKTSKSQQRQTN